MGGASMRESVAPTVIGLVADPIPNIRFNVAKSLEALIPLMRSFPESAPLVEESVLPSLKKLREDSDKDVQFYANRAISAGRFY
jgi:serine/threonine-protein phosphatase 2A regulatory subunit A